MWVYMMQVHKAKRMCVCVQRRALPLSGPKCVRWIEGGGPSMYVCVCVCVREKCEKEREKGGMACVIANM